MEPASGRLGLILAPSGTGHVVLIAGPAPGGRVVTREGNSGNCVAARVRSATEFAGFVDVG